MVARLFGWPPGAGRPVLPHLLLLLLAAGASRSAEPRQQPLSLSLESLLLQEPHPPTGDRSAAEWAQAAAAAGRCPSGDADAGPAGRGGEGSFFSARADSIIRTKDSIAAGATFLGSPGAVTGPRQCLDACCVEPHCTLAVLQQESQTPRTPSGSFRCYLFNCTYRGRSVCLFSPHRGYSSYRREPSNRWPEPEMDEPPLSKAGKDIMLQLPVNWVILDGRESRDDHGITQYEWTLLQGTPSVDIQVPQPGTLKLSHLQEGKYVLQLTVTDTAGQRNSDNVSVTVLPMDHSMIGCVGVCSRYQFLCDDGCCIDITYACDGEDHCPDGSDETFCQKLNLGQKTTHTAISSVQQNPIGLTKDASEELEFESTQKTTLRTQESDPDKFNLLPSQGPKKQTTELTSDSGTSGKDTNYKNENNIALLKGTKIEKSHPVPEAGAVLPLALGLAITALLLLMVACRLRLVRQKLKKARPLMSEESDYLINGMYL